MGMLEGVVEGLEGEVEVKIGKVRRLNLPSSVSIADRLGTFENSVRNRRGRAHLRAVQGAL